MQQQHIKQRKENGTSLKIIHGGQIDSPTLTVSSDLVTTAWIFAKSCLWNSEQYSTKESDKAMNHILRFLQLYRNPRSGFSVFCQRILIASSVFTESSETLHALPSVWLDRQHSDGFSVTRAVYKDVRLLRESLPSYKRALKALAEAALEYSESPSLRNYRYWTHYFIEKEEPGFLNLFQLFVANFLHAK